MPGESLDAQFYCRDHSDSLKISNYADLSFFHVEDSREIPYNLGVAHC
jgi:hypothetical protein